MYQQPRPNPEIDIDKILESIRKPLQPLLNRFGGGGGGMLAALLVIVAVGVAIWLATGFYQVQPSELAARRLFGGYTPPLQEPGLHWYWPGPIGKVAKASVTETRRMDLGFRSLGGGQRSDVLSEALMITGDLNIADVQVVVQYRISDLFAFLFKVDDPGDAERGVRSGSPDGLTLKDATEAALRQVVGQRSIDDVLTINREAVQAETLTLLSRMLKEYDSGIQVLEVRLQSVQPPDPVREAFDDVVRARVDKEARINEALAYSQDQVPRARGDAQKITNAAEAFKQERILKATGEASRFLSVLREYQDSKEVTRQRLYLEAMEQILPGINKFIVNPDAGGNLLPILNVDQQKK
ncbi:MAG: FtsH protease activity modulator HflK [Chloroflexi bacterium]|nr:FtsH protease activity modulator HflK [Chloroflexota bacterium]